MKKQIGVVVLVIMLLIIGLSGCTETEAKDTDGDGYNDDVDAFPELATEWLDTDKDGVGDNADAFDDDSTQWADRDGDGYGENSNGFNPDDFPDDPEEWRDSDKDGFGDNADVYDQGDAAVKVTIEKFNGDSQEDDEDGGTIDPVFTINLNCWATAQTPCDIISSTTSSVFFDQESIIKPYSITINIPEDTYKISPIIFVRDYDSLDRYESIEVNGHQMYLKPHTNSSGYWTRDGMDEYAEYPELYGIIEVSAEIVNFS